MSQLVSERAPSMTTLPAPFYSLLFMHILSKITKKEKMRTSINITDKGEKEAREDFGKLMLSRDLPMNFFWVEMYTKMAQNINTILLHIYT